MSHTLPDRSKLPDGAERSNHQPSPTNAPSQRTALPHWQARHRLALLLDTTAEPELLERLRLHLADCTRCQHEFEQLRQAEAWFQTQPPEIPQIAASQNAAWAAIQARLNGQTALAPNGTSHLNGTSADAASNHTGAGEGELVPLAVAGNRAKTHKAHHLERALPAPQTPAPLATAPKPARKPQHFTSRTALIATLAASFLVSGLAALILVNLPGESNTSPTTMTLIPPITDILDPGNSTPVLAFDSMTRNLLTLTSDERPDCPSNQSCSGSVQPACLHFSMLNADTGQRLSDMLPACVQHGDAQGADTFIDLYEDNDRQQALLIDSNQQVTTIDSQSGAPTGSYPLACCTSAAIQAGKTLLDTRDHLLLTAGVSAANQQLQVLVAQDETSGQTRYQTPISGGQLQGALLSTVTGWLYLWTSCDAASSGACVEIYQASTGQEVNTWVEQFTALPLAADPTENILYVRQESQDGNDATLALDGSSGVSLAQLPPAYAVAVNGPLHHAYLLGDEGVAIIDTRNRRKLSTLPVLAHDDPPWTVPAVDERYDRVYLPTVRGKVLTAQDNSAGQLQLGSPSLQAALDAERLMAQDWEHGQETPAPWELPVGPGNYTFYYLLEQALPNGCKTAPVAARTVTTATPLSDGSYSVTISLAWDDQPTPQAKTAIPSASPPSQPSYPHEHSWLYHIPASGGAQWTSDQGEALPRC